MVKAVQDEGCGLCVVEGGLVAGIAECGAKASVACGLGGQWKWGCCGEVLCCCVAAGIHVDGGIGWEMFAEDLECLLGGRTFGEQVVQVGGWVVMWGVAVDEEGGKGGWNGPAKWGSLAAAA